MNLARVYNHGKILGILVALSFLYTLSITPAPSFSIASEVSILSENFEGNFPNDNGWTVGDLNVNNGEDYWDDTEYKANSGSKSGWVAQIGTQLVPNTIFTEGFEGAFGNGINSWTISDDNPLGTTTYWDDVGSTFGGEGTHEGSEKAYTAGFGYGGSAVSPTYQNYMESCFSRSVNLIGYVDAYVSFWYKVPSLEFGDDYGLFYVNEDVRATYVGTQTTWTQSVVWLTSYVESVVDVCWTFHSDSSVVAEGWYVDDISIVGLTTSDNTVVHQYDNNMNAYMTKQVDLNDYVSATLSYYYWLDGENNYDYLHMQTSTNGIDWVTEKSYTDNSAGWVQDNVDLTPFAGSSIHIRFLFQSDESVHSHEGAYLDDIVITAITQDDAGTGGDAGDDFATATPIIPGSYEGYSSSSDPSNYYKVNVPLGYTITTTMTPQVGADFDLKLYNPSQELVASSSHPDIETEIVSMTLTGTPLAGDYYIQVFHISELGTYSLNVEIQDEIPPNLSITSPMNGSYAGLITTITGTSEDTASGINKVEVKINDGEWQLATGTTSWGYTWDSTGFSPGPYTITAKATDNEGNEATNSISVILENLPPIISITSPPSYTESKSSTMTFDWEGSDAETGINHYEIKLNENDWINVGMDTSYTFSNLPDGNHVISVKAVDKAGNSETTSINLTVNTSLILGPGWTDDVIVFGGFTGAVIGLGFYGVPRILLKRTLTRFLQDEANKEEKKGLEIKGDSSSQTLYVELTRDQTAKNAFEKFFKHAYESQGNKGFMWTLTDFEEKGIDGLTKLFKLLDEQFRKTMIKELHIFTHGNAGWFEVEGKSVDLKDFEKAVNNDARNYIEEEKKKVYKQKVDELKETYEDYEERAKKIAERQVREYEDIYNNFGSLITFFEKKGPIKMVFHGCGLSNEEEMKKFLEAAAKKLFAFSDDGEVWGYTGYRKVTITYDGNEVKDATYGPIDEEGKWIKCKKEGKGPKAKITFEDAGHKYPGKESKIR